MEGVHHFSTELYKTAAKRISSSENVCISPVSVVAALGMIGSGTRGSAAFQIKNLLGLQKFEDELGYRFISRYLKDSLKGDEYFTLHAVNQLYVSKHYKMRYSHQCMLKDNYGSPAKSVDFSAEATRADINKWIEEHTHGKITDFFPSRLITETTKLVLANAVYFSGKWETPFYPGIKLEPFHVGSETLDVSMMHLTGVFRNGKIKNLDARALELPYAGRKLSLFIILPNDIDGLSELESKLNTKILKSMVLHMKHTNIEVSIPKFKIETDLDLPDVLTGMGVPKLFDDSADLSGLSKNQDLSVSGMLHKTCLIVDTSGCDEDLPIGERFELMSDNYQAQPFIANHPFYFFISENKTKLTFFSGRVVRPQFDEVPESLHVSHE